MKQAKPEPVKLTKAAAQILEAAIELFADYGYFGTTIRHVAEKAKVTPMSVYRLFKNKPSLFRMALTTVIARLVNQEQFLKTVFDHKKSGNVSRCWELSWKEISFEWYGTSRGMRNRRAPGISHFRSNMSPRALE